MTTNTGEQRNRQIAQSTIIVMVAFGIAKAISLAQTVIIVSVFGISREWDAFVAANSIPELIFTLIAGGALANAFIPVFSGFLARGERDRAWRMASQVINTIFTLSFIVSAFVFVFAPTLVREFIAPGFDEVATRQTIELMRILLLSTLIFSVSGIAMGILQSHNHFLLPALAPIMFDVGILFGAIFLIDPFGVNGIAMGAVLGAMMHFGIQVPGLIRYRATWTAELGLRDPELRRVIKLMLPRVAGLGVFSLNFLVMNNIASRLGTGSVSALSWGWRLMQIPETLIGTAMGTVIFPTLASMSELGDVEGKRNYMSGALRFIMIATIPSAVGLIMVGRPVLSLLEGQAFDASASALVFSTLRFFALGLVVHSALEVVARSFYADKDTYTPLWAALGGAAINLVLSFALSDVGRASAFGLYNDVALAFTALNFIPIGNVSGLALANTAGVAFEVVTLLWVLKRRWHSVNEDALSRTVVKTLVASLVMGLTIVIIQTLWQQMGLDSRGRIVTIGEVAIETGIGGLVFLGAAIALRMEEITILVNLIMRRTRQPVEVEVEAAV
ncbi:MAG: murein biosynthesis integral membrane protein MurJ [Chloroflexi bacterium]|nr:MAG: murein biosynthesis integral membrane protein MurJ [Phototrophicales bacterium]RMF76927.1 MAG: murein biosynthesis integral membrane protein MurJ [Chloroflexota bacterium]